MSKYAFTWSDLAFGSKKPITSLKATFIAAPREMSAARFKQLVKTYLPKGNIVLGLSEELYVAGFENQPQFKMSQLDDYKAIIDLVNKNSAHKIYTLSYSQNNFRYLLEKLDFKKVVLVNGSWKYAFHMTEPFYILANKKMPFEYVSPFTDEDEAKQADAKYAKLLQAPKPTGACSEYEMLALAGEAGIQSFDYNFQTGVSLGKLRSDKTYEYITSSFNKVVPYQTYAMHHGAARERNFSPPNDLNHYDTVHAEVMLLVKAAKEGIDLSGKTVFINLLPCPACSRMLSETDIVELVYSEDHSKGYAIKILEAAGKTVRRIIPEGVDS